MALNRQDFISHNTATSRELHKKAQEVIPGGVTANIKHIDPHPIVMEKGNGSKLYDVDQNEYIDYLLSYGALIAGHGHSAVFDAAIGQMREAGTTIFGTPHRLETVMAEKLVSLYPSIEMVRFTNSGLEATMLAIRAAMAYAGKSKIAKFEGHYHGGYDQVLMSVNPDHIAAGDPSSPNAVPESLGIPDYYQQNTVVLPFNDLEATEKILRQRAGEVSAIIMEPVQGGFIPADQTFIEGVRTLTEELGILLIFDEVKTGFRLALGGAQESYGVTPDLTALGKVLGGGFPVGAIGGKKEIMDILSPAGSRDILTAGADQRAKHDTLFHSGTYNGHPTVLASGLATIEILEKDRTLQDLFDKTNRLRNELEELYQAYNIPMQTVGRGSIFNIILAEDSIKNYRDLKKADTSLRKELDYELLNLGIYTKPLNRYSLSTAHSEEDLKRTVEAHKQAIENVMK
ncbi:aspartate aminotransferase family protein [Halobacillus sp. B29]|uniref:aspartate aminotransferase family protein n=1 Tax=Halobacillus sp. B29 TaxID=3457432 RepID=UPI003FCD50AD